MYTQMETQSKNIYRNKVLIFIMVKDKIDSEHSPNEKLKYV